MNWRMLLLLAFLLPLPTGLAAQKKKKEKEKAEQPKIEMTFQEKIKPFGPPPIREKEPGEKDENHSAEYMSDFNYKREAHLLFLMLDFVFSLSFGSS